ncbi:MAG: hypothetical protein NVSMB64_22880 [Candidatus Velthaea sp.]
MENKLMFCKVTWMTEYRGEIHEKTRYRNIDNDLDDGERQGGEAYLFKPYHGNCYGYVHLGRTDPDDDETIRKINVQAVGASPGSHVATGVHVIWIASHLDGGMFVVGEYRNATVYRERQERVGNRRWSWNISAPVDCVRFVAEKERRPVTGVSLRRGNLWYARKPSNRTTRTQAKRHLDRYGRGLTTGAPR